MFIPSLTFEVLNTQVFTGGGLLLLYLVLIRHVQYAYFDMIWKLPLGHKYVYFQQVIFSFSLQSQGYTGN